MKKNGGDSDPTASASASSKRRKTPATTAGKTRDLKKNSDGTSATSQVSRRKNNDVESSTKAGAKVDSPRKKRASLRKSSKPSLVQKKDAVASASDLSDVLNPVVTPPVIESATSNDGFEYNMDAVNAKIAAVPLSGREIARREALALSNLRSDSRAFECPYSNSLPKWNAGWLIVQGARKHNLKSITVPFPLSAFTVVTGVSGSGKSSLVQDVLYSSVARELNHSAIPNRSCDGVSGCEQLNSVIYVDQSPIGQTATSNPATYTGLFDLIRNLFAQLPESKIRGYSARQFSFNVPGGRCEKCEGAGLIKVEMHFLADVWIVCDACGGMRYNSETLKVKYRGKSIADVLETTCGDALELFRHSRPITRILKTLCEVGLDYLPLGQSATTLSGGEAQRVKLAAELSRVDSGRTLYVLDEPTTGLHFEDVRKLLDVLHRLVDLGNTVVVVEHNLDVVKNADWILEIGPEAGLEGGNLVFAGTPEQLLEYTAKRSSSSELQRVMARSYTGEALFPVFENGIFYERPSLDVARYWESVKEATSSSDFPISSTESEPAVVPWKVDGRRWHTELRSTPAGVPCRWDSRILTTIVDRLVDSYGSLRDSWETRSLVEVKSDADENAWFLRATTSDEWLLKLHFRTKKRSFNRDILTRKLALRTLSDMEEIPLFGTQSRVRVENVGAWQEIEIRAFSFAEIDKPEFWTFLDVAAKNFIEQINTNRENEPDITPWKTKGRDWHFSPLGFYGDSSKPNWSFKLLEKVVDVVIKTDTKATVDWRQKISVLFSVEGSGVSWIQVFTKNVDFICVQVALTKNSISTKNYANLGFEPICDVTDPKVDLFYIRFRSEDDFDERLLQEFLTETIKYRVKG